MLYGGIAQLARATGSYPVGHGFKSNSRYQRPVGQAAKTPPFHGGNGSSILPRVTKKGIHHSVYTFFDYSIRKSKLFDAVKNSSSMFCLAKLELSVAKQILPRVTKKDNIRTFKFGCYLFIQAAGLVWNHASACMASPQAHGITEGVFSAA